MANPSIPAKHQRPTAKPAPLRDKFELRWSESGSIDGLWVGYFGGRDVFPRVFDRVGEALRLIKANDPLRYDRLRRDLDRIWTRLLSGSHAQYRVAFKSCELDERFVLDDTTRPEDIASAIVHEAAHARLICRGIGYEAEIRVRVEAVCIRREVAFAAKLPDGEQVRAKAQWALTELTGVLSDYWADASRRDRDDQAMADNFRYIGVPDFLVGPLVALGRFIRRVRTRARRRRAGEA